MGVLGDRSEYILAAGDLTDNMYVITCLQKRLQTCPHNRMVVGNEHANSVLFWCSHEFLPT